MLLMDWHFILLLILINNIIMNSNHKHKHKYKRTHTHTQRDKGGHRKRQDVTVRYSWATLWQSLRYWKFGWIMMRWRKRAAGRSTQILCVFEVCGRVSTVTRDVLVTRLIAEGVLTFIIVITNVTQVLNEWSSSSSFPGLCNSDSDSDSDVDVNSNNTNYSQWSWV